LDISILYNATNHIIPCFIFVQSAFSEQSTELRLKRHVSVGAPTRNADYPA